MAQEDMLQLILEKLGTLESNQKSLEEGQRKLEEGQKRLEEGQKNLEEGQKNLEEGQDNIRRQIRKLQRTDDMLLDEIERVHEIMMRRTEDLKKRIG